jgi:acyl dehydratase
LRTLTIRAVNTAADSENKIHDDRVAAQFGFRGGLVPGVTVYGYLAEAARKQFGDEWLARGAMDARFHQPVYDGEEIEVVMREESDTRVTFEIAGRATGLAWLTSDPAPDASEYKDASLPATRPPASVDVLKVGTVLGTLVSNLDLAQSRMSAPLDPAIGPRRVAHPAVLLALANEVLVRNVELGPWIHVASEVRKFAVVRDGDPIRVRAHVIERYERKGHEFVVLDVAIVSGDRVAEQVRHTAIWRPRTAG